MTIETTSPIQLVHHHATEMIPYWLETPHASIEKLVNEQIIPNLEKCIVEGQLVYEFLKDPQSRLMLVMGLITAIKKYIENDYEIIPDQNPDTGNPNTDFICNHCGNYQNGTCCQLVE